MIWGDIIQNIQKNKQGIQIGCVFAKNTSTAGGLQQPPLMSKCVPATYFTDLLLFTSNDTGISLSQRRSKW